MSTYTYKSISISLMFHSASFHHCLFICNSPWQGLDKNVIDIIQCLIMKLLQDVTRETGISYYTLVKYTGLGLIPKAKRVWRGRKGSISVYPNETVNLIRQVQREQKDGLSLRQIADRRQAVNVEKGVATFAGIMEDLPCFNVTSGTIIKQTEKRDGSIEVIVKLVGYKGK